MLCRDFCWKVCFGYTCNSTVQGYCKSTKTHFLLHLFLPVNSHPPATTWIGEGWLLLPPRNMKLANQICSSCCVTGQCNTQRKAQGVLFQIPELPKAHNLLMSPWTLWHVPQAVPDNSLWCGRVTHPSEKSCCHWGILLPWSGVYNNV